MKVTFWMYEIENEGDAEYAVTQIYDAGGKKIKILEKDYEEEESALFSAHVKNEKKFFENLRSVSGIPGKVVSRDCG